MMYNVALHIRLDSNKHTRADITVYKEFEDKIIIVF